MGDAGSTAAGAAGAVALLSAQRLLYSVNPTLCPSSLMRECCQGPAGDS